ncbi:MAG: copper/silver efflux system protein, partial [Proteiniphilum sp.]|nr:copper/silver efflux system protein [Proteiniphilum sp.]
MLQKVIHYLLHNRLITMLLLLVIIIWGISTAPFNWYS